MKSKPKPCSPVQPIYDFQATDLFKIMIEQGVAKKKAKEIIQKYCDVYGLLDSSNLVDEIFNGYVSDDFNGDKTIF